MLRTSWMKQAIFALGGLLPLVAACTVDVDMGLRCDDGEVQHQPGDTFERGCQTCTCNADGTTTCDATTCECTLDGAEIPFGAAVAAGDGCNTCQCNEFGEIECTDNPCPTCPDEAPACDDMPQYDPTCWYEPYCTESFEWECIPHCACDSQPVPTCDKPPPGCYFDLYCDRMAWQCGDIICEDPCAEPPSFDCTDIQTKPGCYAESVCDPVYGWDCFVYCDQCAGDPIECGPDAEAVCTADGKWTCAPLNTTCGRTIGVACEPDPGMGCISYPVCHLDGQWVCQYECPTENCTGPMPECPPPGAGNCNYQLTCDPNGTWTCGESCF
ncbi:MAG: hypothetical protein HOW73_38540 [Polyangiaceae bacterium]|nr:hypothetical protein [Polyangiaceae bacterium]